MKKLKNKKTLFFALLLIALVSVGGTLAYYFSETTIANRFKTMTYSVRLREVFNNTWGTKEVYISNDEENGTPVVLRVNYNEVWSIGTDDGLSFLPNSYNGDYFATKTWTNTFLNDFEDGQDGWYYYKHVLDGQDEIELLTSVTKNTTLLSTPGVPNADLYDDYDYELSFNYEAIQADEDAILDIWGQTATISNGNITWTYN